MLEALNAGVLRDCRRAGACPADPRRVARPMLRKLSRATKRPPGPNRTVGRLIAVPLSRLRGTNLGSGRKGSHGEIRLGVLGNLVEMRDEEGGRVPRRSCRSSR